MSTPTSSPRDFITTRWSLVACAGDSSSDERHAALAQLCKVYWPPLYAFARRRAANDHEARDLVQGFFARLLERNDIAVAARERGRFRAYLITALKHHIINAAELGRAAKRGGGAAPLSLDFDDAERRIDPSGPETPEEIFDRQWVVTLLDEVFTKLRDEFVTRGDKHEQDAREERFEILKPSIAGAAPHGSQADIAATLGLTDGAVRALIHRLRARYRELLRAEVADTVAHPDDVDDEIALLFAAFRKRPRIA